MNRDEQNSLWREIIALLDGALDAHAAAELRRRIEASPERTRVYREVERAYADLAAIGEMARNATPAIDIAREVLRTISAGPLPTDDPTLEDLDNEHVRSTVAALCLDPIDAEIDGALRELGSVSEAYAAEISFVRDLDRDLRALGEIHAKRLPVIDLVDKVIESVTQGESIGSAQTAPLVITLDTARRRRSMSSLRHGLAYAALFLLVAAAYLGLRAKPAIAPPMERLDAPVEIAAMTNFEPQETPPDRPEAPTTGLPLADLLKQFVAESQTIPKTPTRMAAVESLPMNELTTNTVIETRQAAINDPEAGAQLLAMIQLEPDSARAIVNSEEADPGVTLVAAASLPFEEAQFALGTLRSQTATTPLVPLSFARVVTKKLHDDAAAGIETDTAGLTELLNGLLAELLDKDPTNALGPYWLATQQLAAGDLVGALASLRIAGELGQVNTYAVDSAQLTRDALVASGLDAETATALAALTGGMQENQMLTDIGSSLLAQAAQFEAAGDLQTAQTLYEAAQTFGAQVEASADFSWERLAGLDVQLSAIGSLQSVYLELDSPEDFVQALTEDANALLQGIQEITGFFEEFNNLLFGEEDGLITRLSETILGVGDLHVSLTN